MLDELLITLLLESSAELDETTTTIDDDSEDELTLELTGASLEALLTVISDELETACSLDSAALLEDGVGVATHADNASDADAKSRPRQCNATL